MNSIVAAGAMPVERRPLAGAARSACVEARSLALAFGGQKVLNSVSFDLLPGELVLLRGENGSGKTVLLNVLSGYLRPNRGSIKFHFGNRSVNALRASPETLARRGVGKLWQDIRLFPTMTVLENVLAATPRMLGEHPLFAVLARPAVFRQERLARDRAFQNLTTIGMADRAQSSCDKLSVGQMKRVALARLLQMEASLFLLDEPFAGLDRNGALSLANDLDSLRKDQEKTILIVEHRYEAIASHADRVWTMSEGHIVESEGLDVRP